jgi:heme-degrading monooxygenase HmoA
VGDFDERGRMARARPAGYAYVWEFRVPPEKRTEFEIAYGPGGPWQELFRRARGYVGTELLSDEADDTRYLTIDYWISREAFDELRSAFADEFEAIDRRCEELTSSERPLGDFRIEPGPRP